jgi:hypothetical protein
MIVTFERLPCLLDCLRLERSIQDKNATRSSVGLAQDRAAAGRATVRLTTVLAALAALAAAPPSARATTFTDGEFVTWSQVAWGGDPAPGTIAYTLQENFDSIFAPSGLLEVGITGAAGFYLIFDSSDAIINYLPTNGSAGALTVNLLDPVNTPSGALGGEVVTAALNILFSDAGLLPHPPGVPFGDLVLQNLDSLVGSPGFGPEITALDGASVLELYSDANVVLGGGASPFTPLEMFELLNLADINGGPVGAFAMEHLALPSTTPTAPEPSTWAMLLIGFAGLGFARYRAPRRMAANIPEA